MLLQDSFSKPVDFRSLSVERSEKLGSGICFKFKDPSHKDFLSLKIIHQIHNKFKRKDKMSKYNICHSHVNGQ